MIAQVQASHFQFVLKVQFTTVCSRAQSESMFSLQPNQALIQSKSPVSKSPSGERQQCAVIREYRGALMVYLPENESVSIDTAMLRSARRESNGSSLATVIASMDRLRRIMLIHLPVDGKTPC